MFVWSGVLALLKKLWQFDANVQEQISLFVLGFQLKRRAAAFPAKTSAYVWPKDAKKNFQGPVLGMLLLSWDNYVSGLFDLGFRHSCNDYDGLLSTFPAKTSAYVFNKDDKKNFKAL